MHHMRAARPAAIGAAIAVATSLIGIGALSACTPDVVDGSVTMNSHSASLDPMAATDPLASGDPSGAPGGAATDAAGTTPTPSTAVSTVAAQGSTPASTSPTAPAASSPKPTAQGTFYDPLAPAPGETRKPVTDASTESPTKPASGDAADG